MGRVSGPATLESSGRYNATGGAAGYGLSGRHCGFFVGAGANLYTFL